MISPNRMSKILYKLNESNSNNPANLLVGQTITVNKYGDDNKVVDSMDGILELITNDHVVVRDNHTQKAYSYVFKGFNAWENGIEFECIEDPDVRFYVY